MAAVCPAVDRTVAIYFTSQIRPYSLIFVRVSGALRVRI